MYLLEFCRKLITFTGGIENLQVIDNRDGTRSLLNRISKKLLVTFRAENQVGAFLVFGWLLITILLSRTMTRLKIEDFDD